MKIACVSISRSDWNALGMVAIALRDQGAEVIVQALPGHEAPEMLEADGFDLLRDPMDEPDMIVLCGDRYNTVRAAVGAIHEGIPVAHLAGGDITEGSTDDSYRHAITKLAHLHFPTHEDAAKRILQMGEEPWRVFNHGSASIDRIRTTPLIPVPNLWQDLRLPAQVGPVVLLNWQPDTFRTDGENARLVAAIATAVLRTSGLHIVAVGQNDDPCGSKVTAQLRQWAQAGRVTLVESMPTQMYLSAMKASAFMVGNSSSAYYEASALGCRAIDVGDRQRGRPPTNNILSARAEVADIERVVRFAIDTAPGADTGNSFGDGHAAPRIAETIISVAWQRDRLLRKKFAVTA